MGFYHPATLVKDAQRHGVRFAPIDVQASGWECRVDPDGRVRLGLMYVNGLREETGRRIAQDAALPARLDCCPKCGGDDPAMIEDTQDGGRFCNVCAHGWGGPRAGGAHAAPAHMRAGGAAAGRGLPGSPAEAGEQPAARRYASIEDLIACTHLRRDELATLAEIGALNTLGYDRRSALWQIERAIRPSGELFTETDSEQRAPDSEQRAAESGSPLRPMTPSERVMADYAGTSLTIGPHPLALRRMELAMRGVLRAIDLPRGRPGRRVRVAGAVITRQRPGTAKGFVFLTLEDETGIANVIVRPDLFAEQRAAIVGAPYLIVEGTLQIQEGVTSIKAERVVPLGGVNPEPQSHDFR
jgi:error-prone DNA polymerase